ncbi:hypothetical protein Vau01_098240 [Virgisporangium aurantiacum]|uniref:Uncharacterized protein n=1 Tax=Virgisporangium aurantiacum TaxID=175570 RepID=A0A8J4E5P6_9ACTN|nr:hypothetical protein Vau01_098240 [Virgisporangium aurantiacum]
MPSSTGAADGWYTRTKLLVEGSATLSRRRRSRRSSDRHHRRGTTFSILARRLLRRDDFTSRDHLAGKILGFITHYSRHAKPFRWRYDGRPLAHIRNLRGAGVDARFSVGVAITEPIRQAILAMKNRPASGCRPSTVTVSPATAPTSAN